MTSLLTSPRAHLAVAGLAFATIALAMWAVVLVRYWPMLNAIGSICGDPAAMLGHCPLCLTAAGLTAGASATLLASAKQPEAAAARRLRNST